MSCDVCGGDEESSHGMCRIAVRLDELVVAVRGLAAPASEHVRDESEQACGHAELLRDVRYAIQFDREDLVAKIDAALSTPCTPRRATSGNDLTEEELDRFERAAHPDVLRLIAEVRRRRYEEWMS